MRAFSSWIALLAISLETKLLLGLRIIASAAIRGLIGLTIPGTSWRRACMPHRSEKRSDRPSIPNGPAMSA